MSTNHYYVLHADMGDGEARHAVHLCDDADEIQTNLCDFLHAIDRPPLSTAHMLALAAGPHHPAFKQALSDLNLTVSDGCPPSIVQRTIEMLIACEMLPPEMDRSRELRATLYGSFSTEADWEQLVKTAQTATLSFLTYSEVVSEDFANHTPRERMMVTQLSAAICVAIVQARAELQRELTAESSAG